MKKIFTFLVANLLLVATFNATLSAQTTLNKIEADLELRPHHRQHPSHPHKQVPDSTTSTNWSGYAAGKDLLNGIDGTVSYVSGSWVVPALSASASDAYSAIWVGIDGYTNGTVEQLGTEQDFINGEQVNYAWFEMYPKASFLIKNFPIHAGDEITAEVAYESDGVFKLTMTNHTQGNFTEIPRARTTSKFAKRSSAEWIVEAPALSTGEILSLANFDPITMYGCKTTINGVTGKINNARWKSEALIMETRTGIIEAKPSALINNGHRFKVKRVQ